MCNVATEPGETDDFGPAEHVYCCMRHVGPDLFQYMLGNSNLQVEMPENTGTRLVTCDPATQVELLDAGVQAVLADVVDPAAPHHHESHALAAALMDLYEQASQNKAPLVALADPR